MPELNKLAIILIIVLLIVIMFYPYNTENFDNRTIEFVNVGSPRYDLRGKRLNTYNIENHYMRPDPNIILHPSGGKMWESNNSPLQENIPYCNKVSCNSDPNGVYNDYSDNNECWECNGGPSSVLNSTFKPVPVHSHVPL